MKRAAFEEVSEPQWQELEGALTALERKQPVPDPQRVPHLFRQVCGDLALAQHRMYGRKLCDRLNALVIGVYQQLQNALNSSGAFVKFFAFTFPSAVRKEAGVVWLSIALFFVPFAAFILAAYFEPKWIYAMLPPEYRNMMDGMYGKESPQEFVREHFGSNFAMFGFYIWNNVSIHFKIFAGGVLFGVGAAFAIGQQGLLLGAMFGYVHHAGNLERLYTFCASHSSFELFGLILGGAAGIRMGLSLVAPGRLTRIAAMREAGRCALPILIGSTAMVATAAIIEGFWSPSAAPPWMKYTAGIGGWVLFAVYFLFAGRRNHAA